MLKTIINYVNYNYQFCENIDSPFLSRDINANECYIKSCLVDKNLHEIYNHDNISLLEVMMIMDVTDFIFMSKSPVLKNQKIFHHAFKTFWKLHEKGRPEIYVFDTTIKSSVLGFVTGVVYWFFHERVSGKNMLSGSIFSNSPLQNPCHYPCHFVPPSFLSIPCLFPPCHQI